MLLLRSIIDYFWNRRWRQPCEKCGARGAGLVLTATRGSIANNRNGTATTTYRIDRCERLCRKCR